MRARHPPAGMCKRLGIFRIRWLSHFTISSSFILFQRHTRSTFISFLHCHIKTCKTMDRRWTGNRTQWFNQETAGRSGKAGTGTVNPAVQGMRSRLTVPNTGVRSASVRSRLNQFKSLQEGPQPAQAESLCRLGLQA